MRACAQGLRSPPKKSYAKRPLNQPFKAGWTFPDCGMGGWEAAFFWSPGPFLKPLEISEAKTCQWIFQNCFILNLSIYIYFFGGGDDGTLLYFLDVSALLQSIPPLIPWCCAKVYSASQDFPKYQGFWSGYYEVTSVGGCQMENFWIFCLEGSNSQWTFGYGLYTIDTPMGVSENSGTPKSSILIGFSIINHPFWGAPIFGNTPIKKWVSYNPVIEPSGKTSWDILRHVGSFVGGVRMCLTLRGEADKNYNIAIRNAPLGGSSHLVSG